MRQYDVYRNPSARLRASVPFVIILRSDAVSGTSSVIAAGLTRQIATTKSRLFPCFDIDGAAHMLLTPDLASIPRDLLTEKVATLAPDWNRITSALDVLFTGT